MEVFRTVRKKLHMAPTPRVQVLSDLHLEVGRQYSSYAFSASAPFLLLGGDIGRLIDYQEYLQFLAAQVSRFDKVFLVLGNHEFHGLDYQTGLDQARRLSQEPSIANRFFLLHRARWDDPDSSLTIVGCTLWSAIPEEIFEVVKSKVSDYKEIHEWTPHRHNQAHDEEVAWLRDQVAQVVSVTGTRERRLLVATHHAPSMKGTSKLEHSSSPWTPAFATDLIHEEAWTGVKTWIFGHTHFSTAFVQNGIRLVANQRGYVLSGTVTQREEDGRKKSCHEFDAARTIIV